MIALDSPVHSKAPGSPSDIPRWGLLDLVKTLRDQQFAQGHNPMARMGLGHVLFDLKSNQLMAMAIKCLTSQTQWPTLALLFNPSTSGFFC